MDQRMSELIERCRGLVATHGHYVQHVGASPAYSYSAGLEKNCNHPEIVMVGFAPNMCQQLINDLASKIRAGERFDRPMLVHDIIKDFDVAIRPLTTESVHEGTSFGQYVVDGQFEAVQMFLPDPNGKFPWDDGCDPQYVEIQKGPFVPEGQTPEGLPANMIVLRH